ncbi:hypothetical protein CEUSTIGMA_g9993.t1 [Chlamydomonas eustigma]|uniref:Serine aminopeptidase S33 domain-containing protein n=1 Tax=Chlamydomonas eustigma TaxID=1157962 RepID=A0A250XHK6_9CHLO|nr:hypothetical protein CEUSTIGMA_g9993.t1 [Chlamydomonas eustigma]|eukprot:GAX82567.1 hypothetical protein CEUSTIGMA_g9993.t1 [Chlamydomonas eustigma]
MPSAYLSPEAQKFLDNQPPSEICGEHGTMRYVNNRKGISLCCYFWPSKEPKGIIQILHGHGSYIPYSFLVTKVAGQPPVYEGSWVQKLNEHGYSVCGLDQQGSGRSEGLRHYCRSFDEYVDNGLLLARQCTEMGVAGFENGLPKFVLGESVSGCIAVIMALKEKNLFSGVVLLAPMLSLEKVARSGMNRVLRPIGMLLNLMAPTWELVSSPISPMFPDLQEKFDKDPVNKHGNTRVRNAMEYQRVTSHLMANLDKIDFPFLVFHSEKDTMVDVDGSKALYAEASSADKTLRYVNQMWHVIVKEPGNADVLAEICIEVRRG